MSSRPFISIIIATARPSTGSLIAYPDRHQIGLSFDSLASQTYTDFEVIVVDSLYKTRDLASEIAALRQWPFKWQVVHPTSWWLDNGLWALQNAFNTGAVASRGHHLLFCGDCGVFPPNTLARSTDLISQGYAPHFGCLRRRGGLLIDGSKPELPPLRDFQTIDQIIGTEYDKPSLIFGDTRLFDPTILATGKITPVQASWQWYYGYGFISRTDFFSINGWSELFDGDKALGDVEMGSRLEMCGRLHFYMDRTLCIYEEVHNPINLVGTTSSNSIRSNYDLIWLHRALSISRAHSTKLPASQLWRAVRGDISGLHGWPYRRGPLPDDITNYAQHWIDHQPIFTLQDHCA